jgi:hypothetical protein
LAQLAGPEGTFDLSWHTIDGGGATSSTGGGFELGGTIGQPDAGTMTGGAFELLGGFWSAAGPIVKCPADITGDGVVNVDDLLAVINAWGACPGCPADITGDGVVNVDDLLAVINAWGPCP